MTYTTLTSRRAKRAVTTDMSSKKEVEEFRKQSLKDNAQRIKEHPVLTWFDGTRLDSWMLEHMKNPAIFD